MGSTLCKARETGLKLGREERLKRGGESYVGGVCARVDVMSCLATMRGIVERCVDVNVAAGAMCGCRGHGGGPGAVVIVCAGIAGMSS